MELGRATIWNQKKKETETRVQHCKGWKEKSKQLKRSEKRGFKTGFTTQASKRSAFISHCPLCVACRPSPLFKLDLNLLSFVLVSIVSVLDPIGLLVFTFLSLPLLFTTVTSFQHYVALFLALQDGIGGGLA